MRSDGQSTKGMGGSIGSALAGGWLFALGGLAATELAAQTPAPPAVSATLRAQLAADSDDGELNFTSVSAVAFLDSIRVLLADAASGVLRLWRIGEGTTRTIGARGQGPGEFRAPVWIGECKSDSVYVWDARLSRLTVLAPSLAFVRSVTVTGARSSRTVACDGDGRFAVVGTARHPREGRVLSEGVRGNGLPYSITQLVAPIYLLDSDGTRLRTLPDVVLGESIITPILPGEPIGSFPRPFGYTLSIAFANGLLAMTDLSGAITSLAVDGSAARRRLGGAPRVPLDAGDAERGLAYAARGVPAQILSEYEAIARGVPPTTHLAPTRLVPCVMDSVCYVASAPGAPRTELVVVTGAGERRERVTWDGEGDVLAVRDGMMVLWVVDSEGEGRLTVVEWARRPRVR